MKKPKSLEVKNTGTYDGDSLSASHLDDTKKCHIMTSSYGNVTSASLNNSQVKKLIAWLDRWVTFKESSDNHDKASEEKNG